MGYHQPLNHHLKKPGVLGLLKLLDCTIDAIITAILNSLDIR